MFFLTFLSKDNEVNGLTKTNKPLPFNDVCNF